MWRHTLTIGTTAQTGRRWMDGERQRIELSKVSPESFGVLCPDEQKRVKPRPVPPPQVPGGRFQETDGQGPSSSGA